MVFGQSAGGVNVCALLATPADVAAQSEAVYRYFFTEVPDSASSSAYGAFHGLELLFVYRLLDVGGYAPTGAERALSLAMQRYRGSFAATGAPAAAGSPAWTPFDPATDSHLVFDSESLRMADGVNTTRCGFWAQLGL